MHRRALLALSGTALTALAGCSRTREYKAGGTTPEAASDQPSPQGASDQTDEATSKPVVTGPDGGACPSNQRTPSQYPDVPPTLSEERVVEFVKQFERVKVIDQYARDRSNLTIRVTVESVTQTDDGWLIQLGGGFSQRGCSDGNTYVSDGVISAAYFVNETGVYREDAFLKTAVAPRENGTRVA
ncbi:hypothetical protein [Halomarina oriensis]|uniref:Lipoprotein n=1 Tax=Halomarina oriensis TaxID=671145 RepID=A0A6B0GFX3_9EURY|nr:hypothetical protein [Halomarina oriensis]MWG33722.1 hypothetical protein [Halomarina oriensis]